MQLRPGGILARVAAVIAALLALFAVYQLYAGGSPVLAAACAGAMTLAFFVYTAPRAYTFRYLFPGLAALGLFAVLPLIYTLWIGLTNYSSKNLLTFERATEVILGEVYQLRDVRYTFTLHAAPGSGFRVVLHTGDDDAAGDQAPPSEPGMLDAPSAGSPPGPAGSPPPGAAQGSTGAGSASRTSAGAGPGESAGSASGSAAAGAASAGATHPPTTFVTEALPLVDATPREIAVVPLASSGFTPGAELPLKDVIAHRDALRALTLRFPDRTTAVLASLREFTPSQPVYQRNADGSLTDRRSGERITPNRRTGFYETASGTQILPGFQVFVGGANYARVFTDSKFRGPFLRVFVWTVVFAGLTVVFTCILGTLLAELLSWEALRFAGLYRVLLFLPYAVPGFISILVFKGLFNRNFGEINLILEAVLGIRPNWTGNAWLARSMILLVNTWLGYPYIMLLCMGLQKSISHELYEASALAGAGPLTNFFQITWPLIRKPLTPLLIASFAFNFNNFVLIYLLTQGRPDFLDTSIPAGETDILVSYTYRIAFEDTGQNFGLAAAISTVIFAVVAILSVVNLRLTRATAEDRR